MKNSDDVNSYGCSATGENPVAGSIVGKDVTESTLDQTSNKKMMNQCSSNECSEREEQLNKREEQLNKRERELNKREGDIKEAELKARSNWENEFQKRRLADISKREDDFTRIYTGFQKSIESIHQKVQESIKKMAENEAKQIMQAARDKEESLNQKEESLNQKEESLNQEEIRQKRKEANLKSREKNLESREKNLESDIENGIKVGINAKVQYYENRLRCKEGQIACCLKELEKLRDQQDVIETFKERYQDTPEGIQNRLNKQREEIQKLKDDLAKRPPESVEKENETLRSNNEFIKGELEKIRQENSRLTQENMNAIKTEQDNISLTYKNRCLQSQVEELNSYIENYKEQIKRLCTNETKLSDYEERVAEIRKGISLPLIGAEETSRMSEISEIEWLQKIEQQCEEYGILFPRRILYAFHTALKISDWAPLTILAGVSGTGKSELPKLYAAFGGLNFLAVPVQPDWDSQESMLGFFNSIDNRFEPEDLLRFLVQCTEDEKYNQYMSIVMLDEMNLAHVEHYFANFLSKLESRRGSLKDDLPTIEVKLGSGVQPYRLKLVRSILWTGTMNQDETTRSLSDKVLDRGIIINFPRPHNLLSRKSMPGLKEKINKNRPMLGKKMWDTWIEREIRWEGEQENEINHYREIIESINNELERVGRAIGHRVWQSIEYYIMNYPTVRDALAALKEKEEMSDNLRSAMKIAFEDQIVQKIMPKLRGVETRGYARKSLDNIEQLLLDNGFDSLKDDFDIACEQGYGQFIWSSAKYIEANKLENINVKS